MKTTEQLERELRSLKSHKANRLLISAVLTIIAGVIGAAGAVIISLPILVAVVYLVYLFALDCEEQRKVEKRLRATTQRPQVSQPDVIDAEWRILSDSTTMQNRS